MAEAVRHEIGDDEPMPLGNLFGERSSAVFSDCGCYRLRLTRDLGGSGPVASLGMVNPSDADAEKNDPTITKIIGFGRRLGISRWIVWNEFAHVATDIRQLRTVADPVGPDNDMWIERALREADIHIVAWGPLAKLPKRLRGRWREVVAIAERAGVTLQCFGTAQDGHPRHPLMLAYSTPLVPWEPVTLAEAGCG